MSSFSTLHSSFKIDMKRYLRSPALLCMALAAPVAAHFMVPPKDADYTVLMINGAKPVLTASVLGLELGILTALLLTPLAYIFLKAGPTRHRPWQITDVTPHSRPLSALGRWVSDIFVLWILLAVLSLAGLTLGFFRLEGDVNILRTLVALWLPAAPALALVAAIHLFLDARNFTRKWAGDVLFFICWMALITFSMFGSTDFQTQVMSSKPFTDAFGYTAPLIGSVDFDVNTVSVGLQITEPNNTSGTLIDAWRGVTAATYVSSRLFWISIAALLVTIAGLIWSPMKPRLYRQTKHDAEKAEKALPTLTADILFNAPKSVEASTSYYAASIISEIKLMLRSKIWVGVLALAAILGLVMPFRTLAGPIILLAIIFPLTDASARWQSTSTLQWLDTLGPDRVQRTLVLLIASILIANTVMLPAAIKSLLLGEWQWLPHMLAITLFAPLIIVGMAVLTRSAIAGRLTMLMAWYVYLSSASI